MPDKPHITQVSDSVNSLFELTLRVDERVRLMMDKLESMDETIDNQIDLFNELNSRVKVIESRDGISILNDIRRLGEELHKLELRTQSVEGSSSDQEGRWKTIIGFAIQLIWVILAAFLLYKLGISAPAVP